MTDTQNYILSWLKRKQHSQLTEFTYTSTHYVENIEVHYYIEFVEDKVYLTIRPLVAGKSDIQPGKDFLVKSKLIENSLDFCYVLLKNELAVINYVKQRRVKDE